MVVFPIQRVTEHLSQKKITAPIAHNNKHLKSQNDGNITTVGYSKENSENCFYAIHSNFPFLRTPSVTQSCLTLCDPMDCSMPDFPFHHRLPEFTQTHVH